MVARLNFGERRAVTLLLCLGIFRLQGKSASMFETLRALPFLVPLTVSRIRRGTGIRAIADGPPGSPCCLGLRDNIEPLE